MAVTATEVIVNIGNVIRPLIVLVVNSSYIIGMAMVVSAIFSLKKYGELRGQSYQSQEIFPVLTKMFIGAGLFYLPGIFESVTFTLFGSETGGLLSHKIGGSSIADNVQQALFNMLGLIGIIAFVRGMLVLQKAADGQAAQQGGGVGKALTHIIGGVFCYHMESFLRVVETTLGVSFFS